MAYDQAVNETAEAVCSALHRLDWQLMGETNSGRSTHFTRGNKPQILDVEVVRNQKLGEVAVWARFPNVAGPEPQRVQIPMRIDVTGNLDQVAEASEACVLRCLELFRDVLTGSGLAGPQVQS